MSFPDSKTSETTPFDKSELTSAFSFHFEAAKGDWTLFTEYFYGEYRASGVGILPTLIQGSNVLKMHITEFGTIYRVIERPWYRFEVLAGARYHHAANVFDFNNDRLDALSAKKIYEMALVGYA